MGQENYSLIFPCLHCDYGHKLNMEDLYSTQCSVTFTFKQKRRKETKPLEWSTLERMSTWTVTHEFHPCVRAPTGSHMHIVAASAHPLESEDWCCFVVFCLDDFVLSFTR